MVIFHSYVSLPEGNRFLTYPVQIDDHRLRSCWKSFFFLGDWSLRPEWNEVHLREFAWGFSDSKPCQDNIASHKDLFRLLCQWLAATSTKLSILYCASSGTTWHDIRKIVQNCAPLNSLAPKFQSENVRTLKTRPQSFGNKFLDIYCTIMDLHWFLHRFHTHY